MSWFRKQSRSVRSTTLAFDQLEDRQVPAVTFHGGAILPQVQVEAAFYGDYWATEAGLQEASDLNNYLAFLSDSSFMDMLGEYGIGRGSLSGNGIVEPGAAQAVDDDTIRAMLGGHIGQGNLQAVTANTLYFVFTAPNVIVTAGSENSVNDFYGYHDAFTATGGKRAYYAVIAHPIGNGSNGDFDVFQTLTWTASHELAEVVTNPDQQGWFDPVTGDEIGDLCNQTTDYAFLNNYIIQAQWSNEQQSCVVPFDAVLPGTGPSSELIMASGVLPPVAFAFSHSEEFEANFVINQYDQLLGRRPALGEQAYWVGLIGRGVRQEQVQALILASPEYYALAGGTNDTWLDHVYVDVLGRHADGPGKLGWLSAMARGFGRDTVANFFTTSDERDGIVIEQYYEQLLGRSASQSEVLGWVDALNHGFTHEGVITTFVSTAEFLQLQGGSLSGWLTGIYQSVLGREPDKTGYELWLDILQQPFV